MRIAQLVSNYHTVSPRANGAIYSHVAWLANGLVDMGNEVHLFAAGDSETKAELHSVSPSSTTMMQLEERLVRHSMHLMASRCYSFAKNVDIIHSHFNLLASFYASLVDVPTVQVFHSPIDSTLMTLLKEFKNNRAISFSLAQRKAVPDMNWIANIYHGVDMKIFSYNPEPKDYFLFLGRITEDRGVHLAIEAAKAAKVPLVIVGRSYPEEKYWHDKIEKHIDGKMIQYVGEAGFDQKIEYLKNAKGLLFPTQYAEVFGYVMIEAMACGTPVIGWNNGSVPEVVADGKTGFVVNSVYEMADAIKNIAKISREATQKRAELYFSVEKMVAGYAKVYERVIDETNYKKRNGNGHR